MQKIIDLQTKDWSNGISAQANMPIGGYFQSFRGIDPFYNQGLATPSFPEETVTPSTAPLMITNFNTGGVTYIYWHSATELKQTLKDSPYTQVDKTSEVSFVGGFAVNGAIIWKNKYIYARQGSDIRANSLPVASGSDIQIKAGVNSSFDKMAFCVGADGNLYHADNSRVGILTSATGTAGNANTFNIDSDFNVRDLINNGKYLVIIADNNNQLSTDKKIGNYRCRVYFWDMIKTTADIIYDVQDSYMIAGEQIDGNIYFFGYNGLYVCNLATSPKLIRPFTGYNGVSNQLPLHAYQLTQNKGSLYWVNGVSDAVKNGNVFAYGNPTTGLQKIFYNPYSFNGTGLHNIIQVVGEQLWIATAEPKMHIVNTSSGVGTGVIATLNQIMPNLFRYEYTKIVLAVPLSSGQSVTFLAVTGGGGNAVSSSETKSYSATNPKQTLIFRRIAGVNTLQRFEDIRLSITVVGASIVRVTTYATSLDDSSEDL